MTHSVLLVVCDYPHQGHRFAGTFYENTALALQALGHHVEVLAVRPYAPPVISRMVPRWKIHAGIPFYELRNGVPVYRPRNFYVPGVAPAFSISAGAYLFCRRTARQMHARSAFDALISFDLQQTGGLAWRLGKDLGIRSAGWATGADMRFPPSSNYGRLVVEAMQHFDTVFYQSRELFDIALKNLGRSAEQLADRHIVLPRGIPSAPQMDQAALRKAARREWSVDNDAKVVLNIGRVCADKGIFELAEAIRSAAAREARIVCVQIGAIAGVDESDAFVETVRRFPGLEQHFRFLPACDPADVWRYLCGADVFAFTSHHEGMPNSLLEAMAVGLPAAAFAIPPVAEIDDGSGALELVPPFDAERFAAALIRLLAEPSLRAERIDRARARIADRFTITSNVSAALSYLMRNAIASPVVPSRIPTHTKSA